MRLSTIPQDSNSKLSFYIAASDQDLLTQVSRMMDRQGLVGLMDTAGRVHYVVDGRKGSPLPAAGLWIQRHCSFRMKDPSEIS